MFAYGHTGSGKTHTMTGDNVQPGVTPRAVRELFAAIEHATRTKDAVFLVHVSYVELYNNQFRNLLDDVGNHCHASSSTKIEIRESRDTGVFLTGPSNLKVAVTSEQEVQELISLGDKARAYALTRCNDHSSRSHCILTLHVQSQRASIALQDPQNAALTSVHVGKLNLVDLAGSERVSLSGAQGETLVEAQNINLSLALLGDVLAALSRNSLRGEQGTQFPRSGGSREPVPYRNSKLTYLLKDSLGGNSKTLMITTLRSSETYYRQSLVSLMYASRARTIQNSSTVNLDRGSGPRTTESLQVVSEQLNHLHTRLRVREREFDALCATSASSTSENMRLKSELQRLEALNEAERCELENKLNTVIHGHSSELRNRTEQFGRLQARLQERILTYRRTCAEQEEEINRLRDERVLLEQQVSTVGATRMEVIEMQTVMDGWQAQAIALQRELEHYKHFFLDSPVLQTDQKKMGGRFGRNRNISHDHHRKTIASMPGTVVPDDLMRVTCRAIVLESALGFACTELDNVLSESNGTANVLISQLVKALTTRWGTAQATTKLGLWAKDVLDTAQRCAAFEARDREYVFSEVAASLVPSTRSNTLNVLRARLIEMERRLGESLQLSEELVSRHAYSRTERAMLDNKADSSLARIVAESALLNKISVQKIADETLTVARVGARAEIFALWTAREFLVAAALKRRDTHEATTVRALKKKFVVESFQVRTRSAVERARRNFVCKLRTVYKIRDPSCRTAMQELEKANANAVHTIQRNRDSLVDVICLERAGKMRLICAMSAATAAAVAALRVEFESTAASGAAKLFRLESDLAAIVEEFFALQKKKCQQFNSLTRSLDILVFCHLAEIRKAACEAACAIHKERTCSCDKLANVQLAQISKICIAEQQASTELWTNLNNHQRQIVVLNDANASFKQKCVAACDNGEGLALMLCKEWAWTLGTERERKQCTKETMTFGIVLEHSLAENHRDDKTVLDALDELYATVIELLCARIKVCTGAGYEALSSLNGTLNVVQSDLDNANMDAASLLNELNFSQTLANLLQQKLGVMAVSRFNEQMMWHAITRQLRDAHTKDICLWKKAWRVVVKEKENFKGQLVQVTKLLQEITTTHNKNRLAALEAQDEAINMDHNRTCKKYEASLALLARSYEHGLQMSSAEHACVSAAAVERCMVVSMAPRLAAFSANAMLRTFQRSHKRVLCAQRCIVKSSLVRIGEKRGQPALDPFESSARLHEAEADATNAKIATALRSEHVMTSCRAVNAVGLVLPRETTYLCAAAVDDVNITHLARELVNQLRALCEMHRRHVATVDVFHASRLQEVMATVDCAHIGHFLWAAVDAKRGDIPCTHLEKLEELASVKAEPNLQVAPAEARVLQIKESLGPNNVFRICKPKAERRAGGGSIAAGHATSTTTALSSRIVQQADGRGQSTAARWAKKVTNETSEMSWSVLDDSVARRKALKKSMKAKLVVLQKHLETRLVETTYQDSLEFTCGGDDAQDLVFVEYFGRLNLPRGRVTEPETICFGQISIISHDNVHWRPCDTELRLRKGEHASAIEKACAKQKRQLKNNLAYKAARLDLNKGSQAHLDELQCHNAAVHEFCRYCNRECAIRLRGALKQQERLNHRRLSALKRQIACNFEKAIVAGTSLHNNAWTCFENLVLATRQQFCSLVTTASVSVPRLPRDVKDAREAPGKGPINSFKWLSAIEKPLAIHATLLTTSMQKILKRRDANSVLALHAALHRGNMRHFRRLGIVVKLRDMYWQELLGAALQESDSKHATLDLPSPSSYRHKGILGIDRWP